MLLLSGDAIKAVEWRLGDSSSIGAADVFHSTAACEKMREIAAEMMEPECARSHSRIFVTPLGKKQQDGFQQRQYQ
jgi:hypothetical protein